VLNRGVASRKLFRRPSDFAAFERTLETALERRPTRLLAYCLMPTHWHLLLWPREDGELADFMQRLTTIHVRRWQMHFREVGRGHLYQGRFKSFPVQTDEHLLTVCRYVEANALRAQVVKRAEEWQWCSLWRRERGSEEQRGLLSDWPVPRPADYLAAVNRPQDDAELEAVRVSLKKGRPFGSDAWQRRVSGRLGLGHTFRDAGRPVGRRRGG